MSGSKRHEATSSVHVKRSAEDYMQAVFYSHQTTETALKAFLAYKGHSVLRTHDLRLLAEEA
ncbi:MAG: HEPN domain-containing protein [Candidatus Baldrarchaeia archaeon]